MSASANTPLTVNAWDERDFCTAGCKIWESATGQGFDGQCDDPFIAASAGDPGQDCTLRDAIAVANNTAGDDLILIPTSPTQSGLPSTGYPLSRLNPTGAATDANNVWDDLDAWDDQAGSALTIQGWNGSSVAPVTVLADWKTRFFVTPTVRNFPDRLLHGQPTGGGRHHVDIEIDSVSWASGHHEEKIASVGGGCITQHEGTLSITDSELFGCRSDHDGGGAIFATGPLLLSGVLVLQNEAPDQPGGGIWASNSVEIFETEIVGNTAGPGQGGGLWVGTGATVDIQRSTFSLNNGGRGAGAWLAAADIDVVDSQFEGNIAITRGGGAVIQGFDAAAGDPVFERTSFVGNRVLNGGIGGAGLWINGHPSTAGYTHELLNCTFSGNYMGADAQRIDVLASPLFHRGMAIYVDSAASNAVNVDIVHTTFDQNLAYMDLNPDPILVAPKDRHHTVFQNNTAGAIRFQNNLIDGDCASVGGTFTSLGGNVVWDEDAIPGYVCPTGGTDLVGDQMSGFASLVFDPLVAYGSAWSESHKNTATMSALKWTSLDFENKTCLGDLSQDLVSRPSTGSTCDAGSYEGP